jgi:hypothetical protein
VAVVAAARAARYEPGLEFGETRMQTRTQVQIRFLFGAVRAELRGKPLCAHEGRALTREGLVRTQGGKAPERFGRAIGVQGGENDVARVGGLEEDLRRLAVACFANEDVVGVLPKERSQTVRERELLGGLRLRDPWNGHLHGVFEREDAVGASVDGAKRSGERDRLSRPRGPGDDDKTRVLAQGGLESGDGRGRDPKRFERARAIPWDRTKDNALGLASANHGGDEAHAEICVGREVGKATVLRRSLVEGKTRAALDLLEEIIPLEWVSEGANDRKATRHSEANLASALLAARFEVDVRGLAGSHKAEQGSLQKTEKIVR